MKYGIPRNVTVTGSNLWFMSASPFCTPPLEGIVLLPVVFCTTFNGTIGTQSVMPFGSAAEVKTEVRRVLAIAGARGGLVPCPTHLLEPEVPWANIEAYVEACREWRG